MSTKNLSKKQRIWIITSCCIVVAIALLVLLIALLKSALQDNDSNQQAKDDLSGTINFMLGKDDAIEAYIYGVPSAVGTSNRIFSDHELGSEISKRVEFDIEILAVTGEEASAEIMVKAPDVYSMLCDIVKNNLVSDTSSLLDELRLRLDGECLTIEKTITCSLKFSDERWRLVSNPELFNMLSGNLYEYYSNLGKDIVDELAGGNE